jgi:dolichyl-phosphate beta-glucosyltransferase
MTERNVFISVVIPTYNEQARIADTLYRVKDYLNQQDYRSEIIVVDDGSSDTTADVVRVVDIYQREFKHQPTCRLMSNLTNSGKGFSVARGCSQANGQYILFMDADASTPIEEIENLLPALQRGNDIAIGSRKSLSDAGRPWRRSIGSWLFHVGTRLLGLTQHDDTQCGFKLYRHAAVQQIIRHQTVARWCFDVEHLYLAQKLGLSIVSVPVRWVHKSGSKFNLLKDALRVPVELVRIRLAHGSSLTPGNLFGRD